MNLQADSQRLLIEILATWVLFAVFALSALAFVLTIFNVLKPDPATKKFLYGVFSVSAVGIFVGVVGNFLRTNPAAVVNDISRNGQVEIAKQIVEKQTDKSSIIIYTQLSSDNSIGQYKSLKNSLYGSRYIVPAYEKVDSNIANNLIKYCNPDNADDATNLAGLLKAKGFNPFKIVQIRQCDRDKNRNVLEVWLQSP